MGFNYYSFSLRGEEKIYYTSAVHNTKKEVIDWAVRYGYIDEKDKDMCSDARALTTDEVEQRNKELYKQWWVEHKDDDSLSGKIPPTIGEVQLD